MNTSIKIVLFLYLMNNVKCIRSFYCMKEMGKNISTLSNIEKLRQDILCEYDTSRRPVKDTSKITYVNIKFIPVFYEIMEQDELIRVAAFIQLSWVDEFLKWQPNKYGSITEITEEFYNIWYPKITSYDTGSSYRFVDEMEKHSFGDVVIKSNGSVTLRSTSSLIGICTYESESWPFEQWECIFTLAKKTDDENMIQLKFDLKTNIDTSSMRENKVWKITQTPPFDLISEPDSKVELYTILERDASHYQNIFVFPGIALLSLSLFSFWLTNRLYCRLLINMLTTLVELSFLERISSMLETKGSHGVVLYSFYVAAMFTSFIAIFFAIVNIKLVSRTTDPPQYITEIIGIIVAVPYVGPVFSYFINDDVPNGPSTVEGDEVALVTSIDTKGSQKWRIMCVCGEMTPLPQSLYRKRPSTCLSTKLLRESLLKRLIHHRGGSLMRVNKRMKIFGGAELLFNKVKKHDLILPQKNEPWTLKSLITWLKDNLLTEKPELFVQGNSVRPGILVLVNDQDWELLGELEYQLKENDHVMFISTLHGG